MVLVLHASTYRNKIWGGPKRYIRVIVHDTTAELQAAALHYRPFTNWADVAGCFHPAPHRERENNGGKWVGITPPHWAGVMRLSRETLNSEIVVHECVHVAVAIYRMDIKPNIILGYECRDREEMLAYIVGDITSEVAGALQENKVW